MLLATLISHANSAQVESVKVYVHDADGSILTQIASVSLLNQTSQITDTQSTHAGYAEFYGIRGGSYTLTVECAEYEKFVETLEIGSSGGGVFSITLKTSSGVAAAAPPSGAVILAPKASQELRKAAEAMSAKNWKKAEEHLKTAYHLAPGNPDVNYFYGLYYALTANWPEARAHWETTVAISPNYTRALLGLGEALMHEENYGAAIPQLKKASEAAPNDWRPRAFLAEAYLRESSYSESAAEAERALNLGGESANIARGTLVHALVLDGKKPEAMARLEQRVQSHPEDSQSKRMLGSLQNSVADMSANSSTAGTEPNLPMVSVVAPPAIEIKEWLPSEMDLRGSVAESPGSCDIGEILQKTGERQREFVQNVEKYTATESLSHQSIDKRGFVSSTQTMQFFYTATIEEIRSGTLSVEEFRNGKRGSFASNLIIPLGLPSLVLIFHPYYAGDYAMTCEGLVQRNSVEAFQVHFLQREDKPSRMRNYRSGSNGKIYPVPLKGRAWIDAKTFNVLAMELAIVTAVPEIQLVTDRTMIDYAPVRFEKGHAELWLPKSAEFYYDWKGKRGHWHHGFTEYLLFAVEDKQRVQAPKELKND